MTPFWKRRYELVHISAQTDAVHRMRLFRTHWGAEWWLRSTNLRAIAKPDRLAVRRVPPQ